MGRMSTRPEAPATRALAWLYSGAAERARLAVLCALEREIGASLRRDLDHQVAHARLAWWREECARCLAGAPAHPLTRELAALFAPEPAALGGLAGLIDCAVWDLAAATFETRRELSAYCERWSAAMIEPLVLHAAPGLAPAPGRALGAALRELELLLALAPEAHAGRLRLPLDELARAAVPAQVLAHAQWPPQLAALLRARHQELREALGASVNALAPQARPPLRGVIVWAALACLQSQRAQARLPCASVPGEQQRLLDGWRAWRAARRAAAGHGLARTLCAPQAC
jgi:phytoene synthase